MKAWSTFAAALVLSGLAFGAPAQQRIPVDDSGSRVLSSTIRMKWDDAVPRRGVAPTVSGTSQVRVRLNTRPWKGRDVRMFMVLPTQSFGEVSAQWTTRGPLQPGHLVSGDAGGLVYAGRLNADTLEDTLVLTLQTDGTRLSRLEQLEFGFYLLLAP